MAMIAPLLLMIAFQADGAQGRPTVSHERLGDNGYRIRLVVPRTEEQDEAAALLRRTVNSLCGSLHPRYGRWEMAQPLRVNPAAAPPPAIQLVQEITCESEPAAAAEPQVPAPADPGWAASAADEAAVRSATDAFLDARDDGRFQDAYAMTAPGFAANEPLEAFARVGREFNGQAGRRIARRLSSSPGTTTICRQRRRESTPRSTSSRSMNGSISAAAT